MLVFVEGGKPKRPEKTPRGKARANNKLNPHTAPGRNRTPPMLPAKLHIASQSGDKIVRQSSIQLIKGFCSSLS